MRQYDIVEEMGSSGRGRGGRGSGCGARSRELGEYVRGRQNV